MSGFLTNAEANRLIDMMKEYVSRSKVNFPYKKGKVQFDVIGEKVSDEFVVNIERKGINDKGCTYQGRIKSNHIVLLRLDVNPTAKHINPSDGREINGTHLHIYDEQFETREAIPFDIENKDLYSICFEFFEKFNIIKKPEVIYQEIMDE